MGFLLYLILGFGTGLVPFSRRKQERDFIQLSRGTRLECGLQLLLILLES